MDYELQSHKPLDLCVVMLGTNDLKFTDAQGSARGMEQLLCMILTANERYHLSYPVFPNGAKILLISPVLVRCNIGNAWDGVGLHALPAMEPIEYMPSASEANASANANVEASAFASNDEAESRKYSILYQKLANKYGLEFMDASAIVEPSTVDGVHLSRDGHALIGNAVAEKIREIFCKTSM